VCISCCNYGNTVHRINFISGIVSKNFKIFTPGSRVKTKQSEMKILIYFYIQMYIEIKTEKFTGLGLDDRCTPQGVLS
jgi:hypothetical protein